MGATIFHNPNCGTSRNVLATIRAGGEAPTVVEYVKAGWTRDQLVRMFAAAGLTAVEALRGKSELMDELGLREPGVSEETILAAMVEHPILVERPFVITDKGTALCRPADKVLSLLANPPPAVVKS